MTFVRSWLVAALALTGCISRDFQKTLADPLGTRGAASSRSETGDPLPVTATEAGAGPSVYRRLSPEECPPMASRDGGTSPANGDSGANHKERIAWVPSDPDRWREATEGYVSPFTSSGQRTLRDHFVSLACYVTVVHNRIHPFFAEGFLSALSGLPYDDPLNEMKLFARVDIIIGDGGQIVLMGIRQSSGRKEFDIGVLDSIDRAAPFGNPPEDIKSGDGNVYFTWEFHRDPVYACSTMNARPFLFATAPRLRPAADAGLDAAR
jgi:hypothetical protein